MLTYIVMRSVYVQAVLAPLQKLALLYGEFCFLFLLLELAIVQQSRVFTYSRSHTVTNEIKYQMRALIPSY